MRIAIDIDSTLHDYWALLSAVARKRFGVTLPYDAQLTWGITRLRPEQLAAAVAETHSEQIVLAAEPYPGAVEAVARWSAAGHTILVMSHRPQLAHAATERWLERIGVQCAELHCCDDKVERCIDGAVDVLIDDSPLNLQRALDAGLRVATISHPWNRDICEDEAIVCADDWASLEERLAPLLAGQAVQGGELRADGPSAA